jgi:UDP-N-acetylmuramoyl-L-alanyl-D-glutamate--2,6-diaminopimelate ligase
MILLRKLLSLLPKPAQDALLSAYHLALSYMGALRYGSPSNSLTVIAITGTKGKSSTAEMVRSILTHAGKKVAIAGTIRFAIGDKDEPNLFKMTMPGRFFLQGFLRKAVASGATHAVLEMTSEGAKQHRHRGISLNALVFTNISPEHIESHGSYEKYLEAKLSLALHLERSPKRPRIVVANADDREGAKFLAARVEERRGFSEKEVVVLSEDASGTEFFYQGTPCRLNIPGRFNVRNALAAIEVCEALGVAPKIAAEALGAITRIPGRADRIERGQPFLVVVDYAHTPDSLTAIYEAFPPEKGGRRICVLGNTGGGRDTWKRPVMGAIADRMCDVAYLTDEDPYDEDPASIVSAVASGFSVNTPRIIMDRREAIRAALADARAGDRVLITGKGTDPYIMRAHGTKEPWSDRKVVEEELGTLGYKG